MNKISFPGGGGVVAVVAPNVAGGPVLWLDAGFTDYGEGTLVTTWADRSGNGNDAVGSSVFKPIYRKNIINGLAAMVFDGIDDFMTITTGAVSLGTIFVVCNSNPNVDGNFDRFNGLFAGATDNTMLIADQGTDDFRPASQGVGSEVWVNGVKTISFAPLTQMRIVSAVWDGTPPTPTNLVVCRDKSNGSRTWGGMVAEILVYNTVLDDTNRQAVEQYLSNKYNLGLSIVV
jgi:hypothetical protein